MRSRAVEFSERWAEATREEADAHSFWDDFFRVFDADRARIGQYEYAANRFSTGGKGRVDLLIPGEMAVEHKSAGRDLDAALDQIHDYLAGIEGRAPWLLVACDFKRFRWINHEQRTSGEFPLADLVDNLWLFEWLAGYPRPGEHVYVTEEEANLAAARLLSEVHDRLKATGYPAHPLREWLTRLLFCLFADDARVWQRGAFEMWLKLHTRPDGSDLGSQLQLLFQVLDTPPERRQTTMADFAEFIYVNGDLFAEPLPIAMCDSGVRDALVDACRFNWSILSPAVFGSLFQNVMTPAERRQLGAHYTTEENILRTIRPLFLDDLEAELAAADTVPALYRFVNRLAGLSFFDPACGCGNFLVVAYREVRRLEAGALRKIREKKGHSTFKSIDIAMDCQVRVDQFYGIELEEFPAKIARTVMYLADHLANVAIGQEFGQHFVRFPIPAAPHIHIANALTVDWDEVLPAAEADYVFGNPPFAGQKTRVAEQSEDLRAVWGEGYARWLDYVTGWYLKAADYMAAGSARTAFVSTNSITQGEQVARVWRPLLDKGMKIDFAHRSFKWLSEADGAAHVHVVIVGFSPQSVQSTRTIFVYDDLAGVPTAVPAARINPYLADASDVIVDSTRKPVSPALPPARYGNKPSDGGHLVVKPDEVPADPTDPVHRYLRRYLGVQELLHGDERYCIWMDAPDPGAVRRSAFLRDRLEKVRAFREASTAADTRKLAAMPWRFFRIPQPTEPFIAIPRHVSENRPYFTVAYETPDTIASDALFTAVDPTRFVFAVLSSNLFIDWLRFVGGTLESRLRFAGDVVYNTFPLPTVSGPARRRIEQAGEALEAARRPFADRPLADLYHPLAVPAEILAAHREVDLAVMRAFTSGTLQSQTARVRMLFEQYDAMTGALRVTTDRKRRGGS